MKSVKQTQVVNDTSEIHQVTPEMLGSVSWCAASPSVEMWMETSREGSAEASLDSTQSEQESSQSVENMSYS